MMTIVLDLPDQPVPEVPTGPTIQNMREIESRKVSEGKGVDYELLVFWDPETGKVYLSKITDHPGPENVLEISPGEVRYHLDHPALIPFA